MLLLVFSWTVNRDATKMNERFTVDNVHKYFLKMKMNDGAVYNLILSKQSNCAVTTKALVTNPIGLIRTTKQKKQKGGERRTTAMFQNAAHCWVGVEAFPD